MFAWILNTKPENAGSIGATTRTLPSRGCGGGAQSISACRISCTPKLLMPEPKKTGDCRPAWNSARSNGWLALADQLDVVPQRGHLVGEELVEARIVQPFDHLGVVGDALLAGREALQAVVAQVEDAAKALAHADGPGDRRAVDLQHRLDFLLQREGLAHLAVHLVHERDDRRRAQPADLEELDRLLLDAFGRVDHHHRRIDGGQHAIGVLGEVLVARRVEQVDRVRRVLELHDRRRHRDAALLLDFHPVGRRMARALACLDGARHQDRAAEEQKLLGERGLAGVRVRDDRERAALRDVARESGGIQRERNGGARTVKRQSAAPTRANACMNLVMNPRVDSLVSAPCSSNIVPAPPI